MNDFTKEELTALKLCIEDENLAGWTATDYELLYRKIESMIDNYCEHQWVATAPLNFGTARQELSAIIKCQKCGEHK